MQKISRLDQVRRLAQQPVAGSSKAQEIVTQARELSLTELAAVTGAGRYLNNVAV